MPFLGRTVVTNLADYHVDSYTHVGSTPSSSQFIAGTTSALTLTNTGVEDEQALSVYFNGLHQQHNTYTISNSVVTFDAAIPTGTDKVEIHYGTQPVTSGLAADSVDSNQLVDGSIDTAHIGDDQVTLAKMASGTDGNVISYDASGNPVAIATGTSGHFLKSQGAGSQPVFAAAGGAWNIIGTAVASSSASLTITGLDSTYDTYAIGISELLPATDDVQVYLRMGDSSGVDSGASDYNYSVGGSWSGATTYGAASSHGATFIQINSSQTNVGNAANEGHGAMIYLHRPGDGTSKPMVSGTAWTHHTTATYGSHALLGGSRQSVITLDRIQVLFSSGNIASGRMTIWGIAHA